LNSLKKHRPAPNADAAKPNSNGFVTAAEMYEAQPTYVRFDQKLNMAGQSYWNPSVREQRKAKHAKRNKLVQRGHRGYDQLASAVEHATDSFLAMTGTSVQSANYGPTAWQSSYQFANRLANRWAGGVHGVPDDEQPEEIKRWQATPDEASAVVRKAAKMFGADEVGFARLDRRWVFSHQFDIEKGESCPIRFSDEPGYEGHSKPARLEDGSYIIPKEMEHVVVLLHEWPGGPKATEFAPTLLPGSVSHLGYGKIVPTIWMLAEFIRSLGYHAIPSINDVALSIPIAVDAGLGQVGRNSSLISPKFGPRCRISKIITDLPLAQSGARDFGITEFCDACAKCALKCGGKAIPTGQRSFTPVNECNSGGVLQWMVDGKKCAAYSSRIATSCQICVRMCPWTKSNNWVHPTARFFIRNFRWRWLNRFWVWSDDMLGYGSYEKRFELFWFGEEPTHRWLIRQLRAAPRRALERAATRRRRLRKRQGVEKPAPT
jgi:epoxyqueuosine reductase